MPELKTTSYKEVRDFNVNKFIEYCMCIENNNDNETLDFKTFKDNLTDFHLISELNENVQVLNTLNQKVDVIYKDKKYLIKYSTINENLYFSYDSFINGYYDYSKKFYFSLNTLINVVFIDNETWFDLDQISTLLKYSKPKNSTKSYLASYYIPRYDLENKTIKNIIHTNSEGLLEILKRGRKPDCKQMMMELGLDIRQKINSIEANVLEEIITYLKEDNVEYDLQYKLGNYNIDMYIKQYNIAIEVDEMGHADRDAKYEKTREDYIRQNLSDKIIRINPNAPNFRMAKVFATINKFSS